MYQPLSLFVGLRYLRAKRQNHFISFISLISMLGIALGVTALITVLSVMNGFEKEIRERILGMVSHAVVTPWDGKLKDWQSVVEMAREHPNVVGAAPFIERETMIQGRAVKGVLVRGIDPQLEMTVSDVGEHMLEGELSDLVAGEYRVFLGSGLARRLGMRVGDKVTVYAPELRATPVGVIPPMRRFTVAGVFEIGVHEYDTSLAIIHLTDAGKLFRLGDAAGGIRLQLDDMFKARQVGQDIASELQGLYQVRDWTQENANYFRAVKTEKSVMFIILFLIVAVAAFNIISTLVMVVTDKQADIAILKTMGTSSGTIMRIFIIQGTLIGVIGTLFGVIGGVTLALNVGTVVPWIEQLAGYELLPSDIYYISELPSDLKWPDVYKFASMSLVISVLATIYPAWRAGRVHPAEALSYE
ncbi:MAG: lipoprotein-releasing ABC transporter permease subunit [Xanthomonadales bacterium]|nr:lipoprotein-releasing ABC transporter permease subunit [Xanthomonadales bacterium]